MYSEEWAQGLHHELWKKYIFILIDTRKFLIKLEHFRVKLMGIKTGRYALIKNSERNVWSDTIQKNKHFS